MTDDQAALGRIEAAVTETRTDIRVLTERVGNVIPQVQDHEARIRAAEPIIATVPGIEADVTSLKASHDALSGSVITKRALYITASLLATLIVAACTVASLYR